MYLVIINFFIIQINFSKRKKELESKKDAEYILHSLMTRLVVAILLACVTAHMSSIIVYFFYITSVIILSIKKEDVVDFLELKWENINGFFVPSIENRKLIGDSLVTLKNYIISKLDLVLSKLYENGDIYDTFLFAYESYVLYLLSFWFFLRIFMTIFTYRPIIQLFNKSDVLFFYYMFFISLENVDLCYFNVHLDPIFSTSSSNGKAK